MRLLLSPWPYFAIAALIALDSGIAATYSHYASLLLQRVVSVIP